MSRRCCVAVLSALGLLVFVGTANAATLGITSPPAGSTGNPCSGAVIGQYTQDPSTPYTVPSGGGAITQWQTYTAGDTPGSSLTFAVIRPTGGGNYTVVGADTETLPNPLPASNVVSFTLASPIQPAGGDTLALYSTSGDDCYFFGGSTPGADSLIPLGEGAPPPSAGQTLAQLGPTSPSGYTLNVAATIGPTTQDAGVQTSTYPSSTTLGSAAALSSTVVNNGPGTGPITFVDQVPNGLQVTSAVAGLGACSTSGQTVTCTISGLNPGQTAPVNVVVTPSAAGNYGNTVSVGVGAGVIDPNPANNSASAALPVVTPMSSTAPAQRCVVPRLRNTPPNVARTVLKQLGCKVRLVRKHSGIRKGLVIGTHPGPRTYAYQRLVTLVVSSGPRRHRR